MAVLTCGAVLWRDPRSDVRLVDGRLVGEATGYVADVGLGDQTLRITATSIALRSVTMHVDRDTRILVGEKEGGLGDLVTGSPVRVSYQVDGDRSVATVVELRVVGAAPGSHATAAAVAEPEPLRGVAVIPRPDGLRTTPVHTAPPDALPPTTPVETVPPDAVARHAESAPTSTAARPEATTATMPQPSVKRPVRTSPPRKHVQNPPMPAPRVLPARESTLHLTAAVHEWIQAARRRNVAAQISLYAETLGEFYGRRDVAREEVRSAKVRAFGSGEVISDVGPRDIQLEPSGRVAVVRFTKWFIINGEGRVTHGNGVQELRWERTSAGWRIIGEAETPRTALARDRDAAPSSDTAPRR